MAHRSTAAQFFIEENEESMSEDYSSRNRLQRQAGRNLDPTPQRKPDSSFEQNDYREEKEVVEMLHKAAVTNSDEVKIENLLRVQQIIVYNQPDLLDNFLVEMLNFQSDNSPDVRRFILDFIGEACKADPETIPKIIPSIHQMLKDPSVSVEKKAIQISGKIYTLTLMWLCSSKSVSEEMEAAWSSVIELKRIILRFIDSDYDAIRTHTVKFIETIILLQTHTEPDSIKRPGNNFSLDDVPINVKVARPRKLEEDARNLFEELLKFHGSRHATSVNLMTVMGAIVLIAKLRPRFMGKVVGAIEKLNAILPPTLERSQVKSVSRHMKVQLIGLLRHPKAVDFYDNITTLLTDLGATNSELHKALPNWDEIKSEKKRKHRAMLEDSLSKNKKPRLLLEKPLVDTLEEDYDDDEDMEKPKEETKDRFSDLTELEKSVMERLSLETTVEIVMASLDHLPDLLPAHFMASYTPIAIAGTESQIKHVARLLSAQITAFKYGTAAALQTSYMDDLGNDNDDMESTLGSTRIPTLISSTGSHAIGQDMLKPFLLGIGSQPKKKLFKSLKLSEVTKPLSQEERQKFMTDALRRILTSGEKLNNRGKILSAIALTGTFDIRYSIILFIKEDIQNRLDLGLQWLSAEYMLKQNYLKKAFTVRNESTEDRHEWTFFNLMKAILDSPIEGEKSNLAWRLYTESSVIPDKGLELLKELCGVPAHASKGMNLLKESVMKRSMPKKLHYLSALLEFCSHSNEEIRAHGVTCILQLYESSEGVKAIIDDQAVQTFLNSLRLPSPPEILFTPELGRPNIEKEWNEELVKSCLHLYFQLLIIKNSLIHELAKVYVETSSDVKRSILRYIEVPIRKIGMESPDLMKLLDTFPKGSETLMTRIIHILTDKTLPTIDLVNRVRNLYAKRISDVRFLIPVINGLTKTEILSALPKLIKLNPNVVKEVFNRLLGIHADAKTQHASPISPVELMVALHNIEPSKCDFKTVIKSTSLCFNETEVYTAEVLAAVINQLMEQNPLPTLLMRTVIQTLALHSKLAGFIMNTLTRLVEKKVWTEPKVWEGFIKCCQRTIPKSIPILLTLPPAQLKAALDEAPELRDPLSHHLMSFSQQQRNCMPPILLNIVMGTVKDEMFVKDEAYYAREFADENGGPGDRNNPAHIKDEPRSPGGDELSIAIKDEPIEYIDQ